MNWWQRVLFGLLPLAHLALAGGVLFAAPLVYPIVIPAVFAGQSTLLGLWLVCLQDSRLWRVLSVLLAASWQWLLLVIVNNMKSIHQDRHWHFSLVIYALAIAVPLSVCGAFLIATWRLSRWQMIPPHKRGVGSRQFSIQRIMVSMGAICIFLAVARIALPEIDWRLLKVGDALPTIILSIATLQFMLFLTMLPAIAYLFYANGKSLQRDWWVVVIVALIYGFLVIAIETALSVYFGGEDLWVATEVVVFNIVHLLTIVGTLVLLRAIGFRLERAPPANRMNLPADAPGNREMAGPIVLPSPPDDDAHRVQAM